MKRRCPKCGEEWEIKGPVSFREECPECAAYMHTCTNCRNYDSRNRGCRLPTTDAVSDPNEMNFCEEFEFGAESDRGPATAPPARPAPPAGPAASPGKPLSGDEARRRFESLFRDPPK